MQHCAGHAPSARPCQLTVTTLRHACGTAGGFWRTVFAKHVCQPMSACGPVRAATGGAAPVRVGDARRPSPRHIGEVLRVFKSVL